MNFNVYYTTNGTGESQQNLPYRNVMALVKAVLATGGEITGIIDVEKDS